MWLCTLQQCWEAASGKVSAVIQASSWSLTTIKIEPCALYNLCRLVCSEGHVKEHQANLGSLQGTSLQLPRNRMLVEFTDV